MVTSYAKYDNAEVANRGGHDAATLASLSHSAATATHHLLEQQAFLENAPEDVRKEYYGALSRIAILNIKAEDNKGRTTILRRARCD